MGFITTLKGEEAGSKSKVLANKARLNLRAPLLSLLEYKVALPQMPIRMTWMAWQSPRLKCVPTIRLWVAEEFRNRIGQWATHSWHGSQSVALSLGEAWEQVWTDKLSLAGFKTLHCFPKREIYKSASCSFSLELGNSSRQKMLALVLEIFLQPLTSNSLCPWQQRISFQSPSRQKLQHGALGYLSSIKGEGRSHDKKEIQRC